MTRDPDWLIENGFEIQADIEERGADLRDATFLAPKRQVPADVSALQAAGGRAIKRKNAVRALCARCGSPRCQGGTDCDPERYL